MVGAQILFESTEHRALHREARKTGSSTTELMRRIVVDHLIGQCGPPSF